MISQIISNFKCENFLDNLGIVWSSYRKTAFEMSFGFGKKLFTKKWAKYHAISYLQLNFGICVCIWKALKALANKGGLGAWGPGPV